MRAFRYALDEALSSLWRGRSSGLLSIGTIAVALFVLGAFLVITSNLDRLGAEWGAAPELSVYLSDEVSDSDRAGIERLLAPGLVVARFAFVSKDEAARRFKDMFADLSSTIDTLEGNPLPASYDVTLHPGLDGPGGLEALIASLRQAGGVSDVRDDREWLSRWHRTVRGVRGIGWVLSSILAIAAALTLATVVRLALHARRDEIEIMQLVGAPRSYLSGPFVMEGVLHGGIGAIAALIALGVVFSVLKPRYLTAMAQAVNLGSVRFLPVGATLLVLAGGMVIGCVAGLLAARGRT